MHSTCSRTRPILPIFARSAALAIGGYLLLALILRTLAPSHSDPVIWLFDLRALPSSIALVWTLVTTVALLHFAIDPRRRGGVAVAFIAAISCLIALANTITVLRILNQGGIAMGIPIPFSAILAMVFAGIAIVAYAERPRVDLRRWRTPRDLALISILAGVFASAGSISQMLIFGKTDYRRPASLAVVFGARVYNDGSVSDALEDRLRTACELYHSGLTPRILMSGGPGDGATHEAHAMRDFAIANGVPRSAISVDEAGLNTAATIDHTRALMAGTPRASIVMVSHGYHLPRVKLEADRAGLRAVTVPAKERYVMTKMPWFMAREVAAQWVYLLRPLAP